MSLIFLQSITFTEGEKELTLYLSEDQKAPLIILNLYENKLDPIFNLYPKQEANFNLLTIHNLNWYQDLVPWDSVSIFKGDEPFVGKADHYLKLLTDLIIPKVLSKHNLKPQYLALGGYSLAGLFATYASFKCDLFTKIASMSGSLWYPNFIEFVKEHHTSENLKEAFFSIGNENVKRNPFLCHTKEKTLEIAEIFKERGIKTSFIQNEGGHQHQVPLRVKQGLDFLISNQT